MKQMLQFAQAFYQQPLLMPEGLARRIDDLLQRKMAGASVSGAEAHAELGIASARQASPRGAPAVAVIPIHGMVTQHPIASMGTSVDQISASFDAALASPQVDAILFDVDSPGGPIGGVPELSAKIAAARGRKPMTAFANGLMASAAYYLCSGVDEIVAMPTSFVGAIGVVWVHEDHSQRLANAGVRVTALHAGKYKTEGAPWEPLSPEAEAKVQADIDKVYKWFVKAVAAGRGDSQANVISGYGEGRVLLGDDAVKANLADRVGTFEDTVTRLAAKVQRASRRGMNAAYLGKLSSLDEDPLIS
jgi:signal peptide peptidase SppA